ncbi:calcium-binding protein [Rubrimonas cliftonensis]|uniref:Hemolysin-type calcium-binding repeat-containing protein n=1 Tax=Rubrimonas cliftonensis TaxID=89524 RepID=A0A1H4CSU8_9RHOB|nr:calcium-binding protein [Rubrimonas cliftonensis]SEA63379.1 hypothetical protein SAMN05444370_1087 [Rubrimonas cliftonensis]
MAEFIVTSGADVVDDGDQIFTLREAILAARETEGPDTIRFEAGVATVTLAAPGDGVPSNALEIVAGESVFIDGDANGDGLPDVTISGGDATAHFLVEEGASLSLTALRLVDGRVVFGGAFAAPGTPGADRGDASDGFQTSLSSGVRNFQPAANGVAGGTGGPGDDGAAAAGSILNFGELSLTRVFLDDNSAQGQPGGAGGAGGDGARGGDFPGKAPDRFNGEDGGNGGAGGTGGAAGDGGDGAGAVVNLGSLTLRDVAFGAGNVGAAGSGGAGGTGGVGGRGGNAEDGGDGTFGAAGDGGDGGNGGRGGDGGSGGDGGDAAHGVVNRGALSAETLVAALDPAASGPAPVSAGGGGARNSGGGAGTRGDAGGGFLGGGADGSNGSGGSLGSFGAAGSVGAAAPVLLNAGDGDAPGFVDTLVFAHAAVTTVREGDALRFSIGRLGSTATSFTVAWALTGLSASDLAGAPALSGAVSFTAGASDAQTLSFTVRDDGAFEATETATLTLTGVSFTSSTDEEIGLGTAAAVVAVLDAAAGTEGATEGPDRINGTAGPDVIASLGGNDTVKGFASDDDIVLGADDDIALGGSGDDTIEGGDGNDTIKSGAGDDSIEGGAGNDVILSGDGDDTILGGAGNDTIKPGRGNDVMDGGAGDDILVGFRGDEVLVGGAGNDTLLGNLDDDTITGGAGDDRLQGGPGFDVFVFDTAEWGDDRIVLDFLPQSDTLDFRGSGLALADLSITQAGDNVLIEAGDSSILVNSARFGALDVADFAGDVLLFDA